MNLIGFKLNFYSNLQSENAVIAVIILLNVPNFEFGTLRRYSLPCIELCRKGGGDNMLTNNTKRIEVNVFFSLSEIPEYAVVSIDRHELVVKVLYFRAEDDEMIDIDLDKLEVIKSFECSDLAEAERKYLELSDASITIPMVMEYLKNQSH